MRKKRQGNREYRERGKDFYETEGFGYSPRMVQNEQDELTVLGQYSYTTPSGLETTIVATSLTYESSLDGEFSGELVTWYSYDAYFVLDGIFYRVEGGFNDEALALETIEQILDAFEYEAPAQP